MSDLRTALEKNLDKMRANPQPLRELNMDRLVQVYRELRDWRSEVQRAADKEAARIKEVMDALDGYMLGKLAELGVESARTKHGTAYRTVKVGVRVADWQVFLDWAKDNELFSMLGHHASKTDILHYMEEGGDVPPGIDIYREQAIQIRKD